MPPLLVASDVTGHPFVFVKTLQGTERDAHIELFLDQQIGYAVVMSVDFDVIVDIDTGLFPLGVLIWANRQRF
jgi:hypothetical protein